MSTWIKDNKSIATVIAIGGLAFIGLTTFGVMEWSAKSNAFKKFESAKRTIEQTASQPQTPTPEGVEFRKKEIQDYQTILEDIEKNYDSFRPTAEEVSNISSEEFRSLMVKTIDDYKKKATERNVKFRTDLRLGFDIYTSGPALQSATGLLKYQLAATNWVMEQALDSDVVEITRVYRERFPQESESPAADKDGKKPSASTPGRSTGKPVAPKMENYQELPLSLTLRGKKGSVVELINKITNSEKYLFTIQGFRTLTEKNTAQTLPAAPAASKSPQAKQQGALNDIFAGAGASNKAKDTTPDEPAATELLSQILGNELVDYHIILNLVVFPPKEAPVTEAPATEEAPTPAEPSANE